MKMIKFNLAKFNEQVISTDLTVNDLMFINTFINSAFKEGMFIDFIEEFSITESYNILFNEMGLTIEWDEYGLDDYNSCCLQEFQSEFLPMISAIENNELSADANTLMVMVTPLSSFMILTELLWCINSSLSKSEEIEYMDRLLQKLMITDTEFDEMLSSCVSIVEDKVLYFSL